MNKEADRTLWHSLVNLFFLKIFVESNIPSCSFCMDWKTLCDLCVRSLSEKHGLVLYYEEYNLIVWHFLTIFINNELIKIEMKISVDKWIHTPLAIFRPMLSWMCVKLSIIWLQISFLCAYLVWKLFGSFVHSCRSS